MVNEEVVSKPKRAYTRRSGNGQAGLDPVGAREDVGAEGEGSTSKPVLTWAEFDKQMYKWEWDNKNARITLIYFDNECPNHYTGCYSECDVVYGNPGYRLSTGEIVEIK
jgi:hypothetical protein